MNCNSLVFHSVRVKFLVSENILTADLLTKNRSMTDKQLLAISNTDSMPFEFIT